MSRKGFVPIIVVLFVAAILAGGIWYYTKSLSKNSGIGTTNPVAVNTNTQTQSGNDSIAQICLKQKLPPPKDYAPGQVEVGFKKELSATDIKKWVSDKGYILSGDPSSQYFLEQPTQTVIHWSDAFKQKNTVTVEEINAFLGKIRKEDYVKNVDISDFWHTYPVPAGGRDKAQTIDRWGYFIVTFTDATSRDQFFKKYPDATLFAPGRMQGEFLGRTNSSAIEATILYKSDQAMEIVNEIKADAKLQDGTTGPDAGRMAIVLDDSSRNASDTTYVTNLAINFSSNYGNSQIRQFLASHPEIDITKTIPQDRMNFVTIQVPVGEEKCYASEFQKDPQVDSAMPNYYATLN